MPRPPAKKPSSERPSLRERTLIVEWTAAGLGLLLTATVVGHALWEGLTTHDEPPDLQVRTEAPVATSGGWRVGVKVNNRSHQTAAAVQVTGVLAGAAEEEASVAFDYVPARGEQTGGLMFRNDPRAGDLQVRVSGYVEP